jgi:predicted ester cyclase
MALARQSEADQSVNGGRLPTLFRIVQEPIGPRNLRAEGRFVVTPQHLAEVYRDYIACLNGQDWTNLGQFVHDNVRHNGRQIGLWGYREMLENDFHQIPDLSFNIQLLISDPPYVSSRLLFDCTPKGEFLGLKIDGKQVSFAENVIYEFREDKIVEVWSVIDKPAIEAQLRR